MKRAEKICSWIYVVLVLSCVIFFRPLERLGLMYLGVGGSFAESLTVIFFIIGAILIFANGRREDVGASIMLCFFNLIAVGCIFYGEAWILEHILK